MVYVWLSIWLNFFAARNWVVSSMFPIRKVP